MKFLPLIVLTLFSCGTQTEIKELSSLLQLELEKFRALPPISKLKIAEESEPGERLILCLTFLDKSNSLPLKDQKVLFYHTDNSGAYHPSIPDDEETARLSGSAITNENGKIFVETILPGDYGSSTDNRHIHTTVFGAKPEAYDIHFSPYTSFMGNRFIKKSDQHFLADLMKVSEGNLITFLTITCKFK